MLTLLANSSTFPTVPIFRNSLPESYVAISLASSHDCTLVKPFGQVNIAERVMLCLMLTPARARTKASPDLAYTHWLALAGIRDMVAGGVARGHEGQDRCARAPV